MQKFKTIIAGSLLLGGFGIMVGFADAFNVRGMLIGLLMLIFGAVLSNIWCEEECE